MRPSQAPTQPDRRHHHADGAIQTIKELQAKGYNVEVRAVATHRQERKYEQAVYQHP